VTPELVKPQRQLVRNDRSCVVNEEISIDHITYKMGTDKLNAIQFASFSVPIFPSDKYNQEINKQDRS